jgi:hypothetical protein
MGKSEAKPIAVMGKMMGIASLHPSYGPMIYATRFADTRPHPAIAAIASEISTL